MLSALILLATRAFAAPAQTYPSDSSDSSSNDESEEGDPDLVSEGDLDDELARSGLDAGADLLEDSLAVTSGLVDVTSMHELEARHQRPSPWGRIDLGIGWRRVERIPEAPSAALMSMPGEPTRRDEVWLVATWRN